MTVSVEQLAKARKLAIKISRTSNEINNLALSAPCERREALNHELTSNYETLVGMFTEGVQEDRRLVALMMSPPTGLWLNAERDKTSNEDLKRWVADMDHGENQDIRECGELKLLFFFGSHAALERYLELLGTMEVET